jgi:hypothetical protein
VKGLRATFAIARRDLRPASVLGLATRIGVGLIIAANDVEIGAPIVASAYCILAAATAGLEIRVRDLTYFTAPLYGRQLARAHAVTASCVAIVAPFTMLGVALLKHAPWPWQSVVATLAGSLVAALVGLSGTLRQGAAAAAYALLAVVAGGAIVLLPLGGVPFYGWFSLAVLLGFLALRAFGETLARYDPLE